MACIRYGGTKYTWDGTNFNKEYGSYQDKFTFDGSTWRPETGMDCGSWDGSTMRPDTGDFNRAINVNGCGDFCPEGGSHSWSKTGFALNSHDGTQWHVEGDVPDGVIAGFIFSVGNKDVEYGGGGEADGGDDDGASNAGAGGCDDEDDGPFVPGKYDDFPYQAPASTPTPQKKPVVKESVLDDYGTPDGEVSIPLLCAKHPTVFFKNPAKKQMCDTCNTRITDIVYHCKVCDDRKRISYLCGPCGSALSTPEVVKAHKHAVYIMKDPMRSYVFIDKRICEQCGSKDTTKGGAMCADNECKKWVCMKCVKSPLGVDPCSCVIA